MRGLDYYNHTVFEFTTDQLGAQGTVLAGGRYDGLIAIDGWRAAHRGHGLGSGHRTACTALMDFENHPEFAR